MLKIKKNKKGFISDSLVLLICFVVFCIVGFIFYILFGFAGKISVYDLGSMEHSSSADYAMTNYLRTPVEINGKMINVADLVSFYCNKEKEDDIEKIKIYTIAQEMFTPTMTAKLVCSNDKEIYLRRPLCDKPSSVSIPSFTGNLNKIDYCSSVESAEEAASPLLIKSITTPDGKRWVKRELKGISYYQEEYTENLLTIDEFDNAYSGYKESEEYNQESDAFIEDIKTKTEVTAPDGSHWKKVGNFWCMTITKEMAPVSCEATMLSAEKLIETRGNVPVG